MKKLITKIFILLSVVFISNTSSAQDYGNLQNALSGYSYRSVGPAFMSGRIADIAIDSNNENVWYVAVGSGGVWKTKNAGTTWMPLTDNMPFYSTGSITIDPNDSSRIWVGTGENVAGRHVGIGHGIYLSKDSGSTWNDMGLNKSEHISKIIVHPDNSNIIWVASQGPLWNSGGDRGLFMSTDGGNTWSNKLYVNEWTGVTDIIIDPTNPDILYAATWQRHRNVASLIDGGPGTSIYKSIDGGNTWNEIDSGLPSSNMGKIGLAISPMKPEVIYAAIELDRRSGAVFRSDNSGGVWKKMSNTVAGATGPHYYQELYASPHVFDRIYLMNVRVLVSDDGGDNFYQMKEINKHSDNHSLAFKKDDPEYLLIGTDGGIYESFDDTESWKFVSNLPITQFYKLAVDDSEPFYNIYGGTQDNNTQGGPSRTFKTEGITNSDWYVVLGGDGHQPATEPGNPDIIYAQSQQGYINRIDMTTGEIVDIRPQEGIDDDYERFNWDSPILVSQHDPKRIYFASQRVWRSEDRGDSWNPISTDLTKNEERFELPIMGRVQSWENAWDVLAMSTYNTITSLAESPINENILYAGTDDGIIQYTENGGETWTKMPVNKLPNTPATAFVNDIRADLHNEKTAYVVLDNHKFGDYKPYLFKTVDGGKKWVNITDGLPDGTLLWRIVQDHVDPNLLFLATEYGVYISLNGGDKWYNFSNNLPTISVRDLTIQRRENDLVLATFGRSFYILDDISSLRDLSPVNLEKEAYLFSPRRGLQYTPVRSGTSSAGTNKYVASNPRYGINFKYHLSNTYKTMYENRKDSELDGIISGSIQEELIRSGYDTPKSVINESTERLLQETQLDLSTIESVKRKLIENQGNYDDIDFPGWDYLEMEMNEISPKIFIEIRDNQNQLVEKIYGSRRKGLNNINWDLKRSIPTVSYTDSKRYGEIRLNVKPGTYSAAIFKNIDGEISKLTDNVSFQVERVRENILKNPMSNLHEAHFDNAANFIQTVVEMEKEYSKSSDILELLEKNVKFLSSENNDLIKSIYDLSNEKTQISIKINGYESKGARNEGVGEKDFLTIMDRVYNSIEGTGYSSNTYGPTKQHMKSLDVAKEMYQRLEPRVKKFNSDVEKLANKIESLGTPTIIED